MKRSGMPARVTPLKRGTGLGWTVPLQPGEPLTAPLRREAMQRRARVTGPAPAARRIALARDGRACAGCGKSIAGIDWSLQHRAARGMGGTSRHEANALPNLVTLCGSATSSGCHRLAEDRDPVMHERGLWLSSWENPALVPVYYATPDGLVPYLLLPDGSKQRFEPEVSAA